MELHKAFSLLFPRRKEQYGNFPRFFLHSSMFIAEAGHTVRSITSSEQKIHVCHFPSSLTATTTKSLQSCPTLCDPMDGSPPGSPVPGILQARTLEWVAISFSNAWNWKVKVKSLSRIRLLATPWTAAYQAPPSTGFSRQKYWSRVPLPSPSSSLSSM